MTTKGVFTFDEASAESVMAEYVLHGIDLMIDYDHASLSAMPVDPAQAGKAAGWFNLEVRNGELWAVNVRWTQPAAEALARKEWRFMSPAFHTDANGRITSVLNVAITNMPATRGLQPLMAASLKALSENSMSPDLVKQALDALVGDDAEACAEILKSLIAAAASGESAESEPTNEAPEAPAADFPEAASEAPAAPEPDEEKEVAASILTKLSGGASAKDWAAAMTIFQASHVELAAERKKLADERAVLDAATRVSLCKDLVTKGGKAPAEVWADDKATAPKPYLASMSIEDFRSLVADAIKANAGRLSAKPPTTASRGDREFVTPNGIVTLSTSELNECARAGAKPEVFAANKAIRVSRAGRGSV